MTPYYDDGRGIVIYHGDCRDVLPNVTADVLVTDPPYGIALDTDYSDLRGNAEWRRKHGEFRGTAHKPIEGDAEPFDPSPFLTWPAALFGANHYSEKLPAGGTWHVWDKRDGLASNMFSDAEFWWTSYASGPTRIFRHKWLGYHRAGEVGEHYHPTQKPTPLLRAILSEPRCPAGVVLDPFMGSGTTLRAAKDLGRRAIGIECEERYAEIAARRLEQEVINFGDEKQGARVSVSVLAGMEREEPTSGTEAVRDLLGAIPKETR